MDKSQIKYLDKWISAKEKTPEDLQEVIVIFQNHCPASYYSDIKDKPLKGVCVYYDDEWYWYSQVTTDILAEYGKCHEEKVDKDIEITHWMPLPELYECENNANQLETEDDVKIQIAVTIPFDKPTINGVVFPKDVVEKAFLESVESSLPITYNGTVIGQTVPGTSSYLMDDETQTGTFIGTGCLYNSNLECIVDIKDGQITNFSMHNIEFGNRGVENDI